MKKITIARNGIEAVILPDFGGMVAQLRIHGRNVLRMYYEKLGLSNVLAGGIPIMFPFAGRCRNEEAVFNGQTYPMPMHGFAKDLPFQTGAVNQSSCEVTLSSSAHTLHFYPFEFSLAVVYAIVDNAFRTTFRIQNLSGKRMPFALGTHPYFLTTDRAQTEFSFGLKEYDCYLEPVVQHGFLEGGLSLADKHDTVFWNGCPVCDLNNRADGYRLRMAGDESFKFVTICTWQEAAACIEPWQGRPDAPNHPEECLWLDPMQTADYTYDILLADA